MKKVIGWIVLAGLFGVLVGACVALRVDDNPHALDRRGICHYCGLRNGGEP